MMDHRTIMGFSRDKTVRARDIDRAVVRRVLRYARPYKASLWWFVLAVIGGSIATVVPSLLLRSLIDHAIPDKNRGLVAALALAAVGLALANAVLSVVQRW